jgi:integrase
MYIRGKIETIENEVRTMSNDKRTTRSQRGLGRLYKRDRNGKEQKATSKVPGIFWIDYFLDTTDKVTGLPKRKRVREKLTDPDGKLVTTLKAAKVEQLRIRAPFISGDKVEHLKKIKADLQEAEQGYDIALDEANPPLKVVDAWNAYKDATNRPDSGERTLKDYSLYYSAFLAWLNSNHPGIVYMRDVSSKVAGQYAANMTRAGKSPGTYNKHTGFLKLLYKVLEEQARTIRNPFGQITRRKLKTQSRRELTTEELYKALDAASGDLALLLGLGTFTGLRLGDCCTLRWGEIDLVKKVIRRIPNKTANRDSSKPVLIGIPDVLLNHLLDIPLGSRTGYLLPDYAERYLSLRTRSEITRQVQAHFEACGIQTHKAGTGKGTGKRAVVEVGFHSLRHTFVSMHAERGTPAAMIQKIVGHSNPAMTRHYTHVNADAARRVANVLDAPTTSITEETQEPERIRLKELADSLPIETIKAFINSLD